LISSFVGADKGFSGSEKCKSANRYMKKCNSPILNLSADNKYHYATKMSRLLILIFIFPLFVSGQSTYAPTKAEMTTRYSGAITEYIKAVYKRDKSVYDTLFFGKHKDFPNIELPGTIHNTKIVVLTTGEADKKRGYRKSLVFINMVGWVTEDRSEFIFVTFYPGYLHQFDCMINFKYNSKQKVFELDSLQFKNYAYK